MPGGKLDAETRASPTEGLRARFRNLWREMSGGGGGIIEAMSIEERIARLDLSGLSEMEGKVLARMGETSEKLVEVFGTTEEEMRAFGQLIDSAWLEEELGDGILP